MPVTTYPIIKPKKTRRKAPKSKSRLDNFTERLKECHNLRLFLQGGKKHEIN